MKKLKNILVAGVSLLVLTLSSCSFFDAKPDDFVSSEDNYKAKSTIFANYMGLLATLQDVIPQLIFVSELRGDLMTPTDQASSELNDIYMYDVSKAESNKWYDPAPFYKIVMNCNDFLRNTVQYNADYPGVLPTNTYRQMIAGAVCLRTWAYLTLGKLYGGAVYYDYALTGDIDISKMQDKWLSLQELVPQLLYFLKNGVDRVSGIMLVTLDQIFGLTTNTLQWRRMSISPDMLLTELYLWNGNYESAAKSGLNQVTDKGVFGSGAADRWSLSNYFQGDNWYQIFRNEFGGNHENEGITVVFWDRNRQQDNPFNEYYLPSVLGNNYKYYLRPSEAWVRLNMQPSGNSYEIDPRVSQSYVYFLGQPVIYKFYQSVSNKYFYIHRASELFLLVAEALTALERFEAADGLINKGIIEAHKNGFGPPYDTPIWSHERLSKYPGIRGRLGSDMVDVLSTSYIHKKFEGMHGYKYRIDNGEYIRDKNGSLYLYQVLKEGGPGTVITEGNREFTYDMYVEYRDRRKFVLDSIIAAETGREMAWEGKRLFTLVRMATQLDNPDVLADVISQKFEDPDDSYAMARHLRNKENWFIKYDLRLMNK